MKKIFTICCLTMYLICFSTNTNAISTEPGNNAKQGIPYKYTPTEGSVEELYKDIIVTLLEPYITDEITKQYGKLLQYDLFSVEFLKIERPTYSAFTFLIKLQVDPFVGAHNTIGIDEIIIRVSPVKTEVEKFEHIKSFPIPPHLKKYYEDLKL
ncbi:DUF3888 domain-containing protein [Clostridium ganghwense]|uniref:DUF3888 domain-containing protein n=1 Tax=Clostridium ganghwense TaxID=312089 RepID=A0ABT4CNS4_9CLOT|nr:DUF3888 domain-containing protein [Clostridium ganghwense]MCY6370677.1 DUF3888 domain-containing protein [Clostridium ganghwense]